MDLKQLEYIVEIAKERNITHAAKNLFISQSALNQQLLKLEKELGSQLFFRSRNNWKLTAVGEIYIENAKKILEIQKNTYNKIYDCIAHHKRKLAIGITAGRGIELFTSILPEFKKLYPNVEIEPFELPVYKQQEKMAKSELDLGFMTLTQKQRTKDNYITLYNEEMYLIASVNNNFIKQLKEPININKLKNEYFVLMNQNSTNRGLIDDFFKTSNFIPKILFETTYTTSILTAVEANLCCGIVPYYYTLNNDSISRFKLKNAPCWEVVIAYKKNSYLSNPEKTFIELAKTFCENKKI